MHFPQNSALNFRSQRFKETVLWAWCPFYGALDRYGVRNIAVSFNIIMFHNNFSSKVDSRSKDHL
jgi:hypothetical protein